jgi:deoxyribodipyrimidine photo-lyase
MQDKVALIWFRNNLRTKDNAIFKDLANYDKVICLYVLDDLLFQETDFGFQRTLAPRLRYLYQTIAEFKSNLANYGLNLNVVRGDSVEIISKIVREYQVNDILLEQEVAFEEASMQNELENNLNEVNFKYIDSNHLFQVSKLSFSLSKLGSSFTKFKNSHQGEVNQLIKSHPSLTKSLVTQVDSLEIDNSFIKNSDRIDIQINFDLKLALDDLENSYFKDKPEIESAFPWSGGESQACERVKHYIWDKQRIKRYKKTRNELLGKDFSSKFSAGLALGSVSIHYIFSEINKYEREVVENKSTYWLKFELLWREYFHLLMAKYPSRLFYKYGPHTRDYSEFKFDRAAFIKFIEARTDNNFINASLIELSHSGYLSNRMRQNLFSYGVFDLGLDWRAVAAWLEANLLDYDVHSNWGNAAYITGLAATNQAHKFDVADQQRFYDPSGKYINHWLEQNYVKG